MAQPASGPDGAGVIGSIRSMARRLSGTLSLRSSSVSAGGGQVRGRPPIYTYDEPHEGNPGQLRVGGVDAETLASTYGTPLYVYDVQRIADNYHGHMNALAKVFPNSNYQLSYSLKANPTLGVVDVLKRLGAGFQIVSIGELARVQKLGVPESHITYAGPGKTRADLDQALKAGVGTFNIESWAELEALEKAAQAANKVANVAFRINPELRYNDIDPNVINVDQRFKFGVAISDIVEMSVRAKASSSLKVTGLAVHLVIGGTNIEPWIEARDKLLAIADQLRNDSRIWIDHINLGGGFPLGLSSSELTQLVDRLTKPIAERGLRVVLEPGKALVADAGLLLARVQNVKKVPVPIPGSGTNSPRRNSLVAGTPPLSPSPATIALVSGEKVKGFETRTFVTLDVGMNAFRTGNSLPNAPQPRLVAGQSAQRLLPTEHRYTFVGPLPVLSDLFARDYNIGEEIKTGSLVAVADSGAYCESLAATSYCSLPRPAEVLVTNKQHHLIRARETVEDVVRHERPAPASLVVPGQNGAKDTVEEANEDNISQNE